MERWVNKWSKREHFEDKPRSGRPSILSNCAQKSIEKTKNKQFNKENCQKLSAEKHRSFKHKGVEIHDQERMEGFQAKYFCWAKNKEPSHSRFAKKNSKLKAEDLDNFLFTDECPKSFPVPSSKKIDIIFE